MDTKNEAYVTDGKKIAINYILKGRFFIDLAASIPLDDFLEFSESNISKQNLKLLSMFKLVRLLRLGRIITFLRLNQAFKQGMRIV